MSKGRWGTALWVAVVSGCGGTEVQGPRLVEGAPVRMVASDQWSTPVHLDAPVNSPFGELGGTFSRDGLRLYFGSNRPGGFGGFDIYVTRRECRDCPWGDPVNLGANVNSPGGDGSATFSPDERKMIFSSARAGGFGGADLWLTQRDDPNDDLGWGPPVNLGPLVNTAGTEGAPRLFFRGVENGGADLVFARDGHFQARIDGDGTVLGPAQPIAVLNGPENSASDVPLDGREVLVFSSNRAGGVGLNDIWISSRRNTHEPWSAPRNLGSVINTVGADLQPGLSWDGRTLVFAAGANARPSLGFQDLWISTRSP